MAKILNIDNTKCWWACGETGLSFVGGGNANGTTTFGRQLGGLLQN